MRLLALMLVLFVSGCGESYVAPHAVVRVEFGSDVEMETASHEIQAKLAELDFELAPESQGWSEDMLDELPPDQRWRTTHTISFWRHSGALFREDFRGDLTSYANPEFAPLNPEGEAITEAHFPFLEITFSQLRPGGFSANGNRLFADLLSFLRQKNYEIVVVSEPPPSDEREHFRVALTNILATCAWWFAAWAVGMTILGGLTDWGLRVAPVSTRVRRVVVVCIGVLLVTPLPVPTMFLTFMLPNVIVALLGGPPVYMDLAGEYGAMLPAAFVASGCLSVIAALLLVRVDPH
ncbi:MAG: hypothetical protein WDM79_02105 [Terricaulis sp.]